jgi:thioredoxin reductase (NADPH)
MDLEAPLDCVVIGAGPAGLVAGMYLRRFHRRIAVLDGGDARALRIERSWNVPGFPDGIGGAALLQRLHEQLRRLEGGVESAQVCTLERRPAGGFRALDAEGRAWSARTVLLATGARDHEPALPGTPLLRERGLLRQCPICDGHEHRDQRIVVIGRGDHGAREALFLRHFGCSVTLLPADPHDRLSAPVQAALQARGIALLPGPAHELLVDGEAPLHVRAADGRTHPFDVLYAALGCHPRAELAHRLGAAVDAGGNLVTDDHGMTRVAGLYAAGDVTGGLDQISVAVGQAAVVATAIHNAL